MLTKELKKMVEELFKEIAVRSPSWRLAKPLVSKFLTSFMTLCILETGTKKYLYEISPSRVDGES